MSNDRRVLWLRALQMCNTIHSNAISLNQQSRLKGYQGFSASKRAIRSNLILISAVVDHYSIRLRLRCGLTEVAQLNSLQLMYSVKALVSMLIFPLHFPTDISVALFLHRCPLCLFHL